MCFSFISCATYFAHFIFLRVFR